MVAGFAKSIENFSYVVSAVLTPLFLVAGTFFPIDNLPGWAQFLANLNPLYHCVELVRHAAFGWEGWEDVGSVCRAARVRLRDVAARDPRDDAQADRLARLVAADERAQALVLLAAGGAAGEVGAQPGDGGVGVGAGELELDVAVELGRSTRRSRSRLGGAEQAAEDLLADPGGRSSSSPPGTTPRRGRTRPDGCAACGARRGASCRARRAWCRGARRARRSEPRSGPARRARGAGAASGCRRSPAAPSPAARSAPPRRRAPGRCSRTGSSSRARAAPRGPARRACAASRRPRAARTCRPRS